MPELPDVEGYRRHLEATCRGRTIRAAVVADARILDGISAAEFARRLAGGRIGAARRHGKHLLVELGRPGILHMHFGMNGALQYVAPDEQEPAYDRLRLDFADGHSLAYVNPRLIGGVGLAADAEAFVAAAGLGPDALDRQFDRAAFERMLDARRREVKALLMDQSLVAGIGNIYSDEILFQARIHPQTTADALDAVERGRLFGALKEVLQTAIDRGAGAERLVDRLPQSFLIPQRRKGGRCPGCGGPVASGKFAGRTAYFCPRCQPAR